MVLTNLESAKINQKKKKKKWGNPTCYLWFTPLYIVYSAEELAAYEQQLKKNNAYTRKHRQVFIFIILVYMLYQHINVGKAEAHQRGCFWQSQQEVSRRQKSIWLVGRASDDPISVVARRASTYVVCPTCGRRASVCFYWKLRPKAAWPIHWAFTWPRRRLSSNVKIWRLGMVAISRACRLFPKKATKIWTHFNLYAIHILTIVLSNLTNTQVSSHMEKLVETSRDARHSPFVKYMAFAGSLSAISHDIKKELLQGRYVVVTGCPDVLRADLSMNNMSENCATMLTRDSMFTASLCDCIRSRLPYKFLRYAHSGRVYWESPYRRGFSVRFSWQHERSDQDTSNFSLWVNRQPLSISRNVSFLRFKGFSILNNFFKPHRRWLYNTWSNKWAVEACFTWLSCLASVDFTSSCKIPHVRSPRREWPSNVDCNFIGVKVLGGYCYAWRPKVWHPKIHSTILIRANINWGRTAGNGVTGTSIVQTAFASLGRRAIWCKVFSNLSAYILHVKCE